MFYTLIKHQLEGALFWRELNVYELELKPIM